MKLRRNKKDNFSRERQARQQASQAVFRRGVSLDMQRIHKIAAEESNQRHGNNRRKIRKFTVYLSVITVVILVFVYLFGTKINNLNIQPVDARIDKTAVRRYQDDVQSSLNKGWFGNLKPFISNQQISNNLQKHNPEIATVKLKTNLLSNDLTVVIEFKKPSLIWQTKNGQRFYVSDEGQAFKVNYSHIGDDSLVKLLDTSGLTTTQGKTVVSNDEIVFVTSVNKQLEQQGIKVKQYSIPASAKEIDVRLVGQPYTVKLLSSNDVGQEVVQLRRSLDFFKKHPDQTPQKYLDLRIIGKAFYQ